jgi:hypothetical protein
MPAMAIPAKARNASAESRLSDTAMPKQDTALVGLPLLTPRHDTARAPRRYRADEFLQRARSREQLNPPDDQPPASHSDLADLS